MRPGELQRCKHTLHKFKNAVIHQLNSNKLKGKIPKLKEILERAIAKAELEARARRKEVEGQSNMEFLSQDREIISDERYNNLSDNLTKILEDIDENDQQTKLLQGKLQWALRKPDKKIRIKTKKGKSKIM